MRHGIAGVTGMVALVCLVSSGSNHSAIAAEGSHATRMTLVKHTHTLTVYDGERVLGVFQASIGPGGPGFKQREGDNVTPVGNYHVVARQPSQYRIFLRLDYPNAEDRARFAERKANGELPAGARIGGDIGIHGTPQSPEYDGERARFRGNDWTAGCIAVQDDEIDAIAAWAPVGTPIDIED
jgi:murein L,D-transpeptidase YafK